MTATKITISIDEGTLRRARGAVRRARTGTISAYIASAVARQVRDDDLVTLMNDLLEKSGGPMSSAEIRETKRLLGIGRRHSTKR